MRFIFTIIMHFVLATVLMWLAVGYVTLEINPFKWDQDARFFHAVLSLLLGCVIGLTATCSDDD